MPFALLLQGYDQCTQACGRTYMTRWILLLVSIGALLLIFFGPSPGWAALGVFGFLFGSIAATLAFAQARITSSAREEAHAASRMARDHASATRDRARDDCAS